MKLREPRRTFACRMRVERAQIGVDADVDDLDVDAFAAAMTLIAAPPRSKFLIISPVTARGYALTPSSATPWSAPNTQTRAAIDRRRERSLEHRETDRDVLEPAERAERFGLRVDGAARVVPVDGGYPGRHPNGALARSAV